MSRNLDTSALRAVLAVADAGGVTRAAGVLNLTQSAVSMQVRRLEETLGVQLFHRGNRKMKPSPEGEKLISYARRMMALNDEALMRLAPETFDVELRLGVPCDIIAPQMPAILRDLSIGYPKMRIKLVSSGSISLREAFRAGEFDMILTTEFPVPEGVEVLAKHRLVWICSPDLRAVEARPLRLAFKDTCVFRGAAQKALDAAGIVWETAYEGESETVVEANVAAGLAVSALIEGQLAPGCVAIGPETELPALGDCYICLYDSGQAKGDLAEALRAALRQRYGATGG
ncbi:LysR family transcriptional regulator [Pseudorhodobacter sp.]|uniref:LysR family transcriptional regulator n=1 Tax=Pseudorhodobacter sp. TaxID=1934400 RepID=UPI00264836BF|nr:LysR family transcriptional regulator [Pseudorhodobacter sp.]MDN5787088.1 LysR family transcriptional regulator [Pseudorhodobacter sp.]